MHDAATVVSGNSKNDFDKRRLAATIGTYYRYEFALINVKVNTIDDFN
jgi:hypothetical protein